MQEKKIKLQWENYSGDMEYSKPEHVKIENSERQNGLTIQ